MSDLTNHFDVGHKESLEILADLVSMICSSKQPFSTLDLFMYVENHYSGKVKEFCYFIIGSITTSHEAARNSGVKSFIQDGYAILDYYKFKNPEELKQKLYSKYLKQKPDEF